MHGGPLSAVFFVEGKTSHLTVDKADVLRQNEDVPVAGALVLAREQEKGM